MKSINIFYEEPDPDRWIKFDRYPRRIIRKFIRGKAPVGGVQKWFINLVKGLDELDFPYEINNYRKLRRVRNEWALVIGKPQVLKKIPAHTNIIYGPGISSHPNDDNFWVADSNIRHIIISCEWFKIMYERDLPVEIPISIWPSGIETDLWKPVVAKEKCNKILIYDKIRWERDHYDKELISFIKAKLQVKGIGVEYIKYGEYKEDDFHNLLTQVDGMIFLCEHETQGFAYLQTLSCDVPILAWDRGSFWKDPSFYPHSVKFEPVTSVPYWEPTCGEKFKSSKDFESSFDTFWQNLNNGVYKPRNYILENFKLASRAKEYVDIVRSVIESDKAG